MMERGSIAPVNAEARARGMSYGQYVGAVYYPVVIVEVQADGKENRRTAAVPEAVAPAEAVQVAQKVRKKPVVKKAGRKCVICGRELGPYQRKYCSDDCSRKAVKERYDSKERKPYVSTAKREDRPCAVCGKLMVQVVAQKKYCSAACNRLGVRALNKAYWEQNREVKERYCQICGIRIRGNRWKYCDNCGGAASSAVKKAYNREYKRRKAKEAAIAAFENQEDGT